MSPENIVMGVDIGGTHITAAQIDMHSKKVIHASVTRSAVDASGTIDEIINTWAACITTAKQNTNLRNICIAMPGPFDYEAGISLMRGQGKYESLYGLNIKETLAQKLALPRQAFLMDNDAACFLQGEVFSGAAKEYNNSTVIGVTLGTGLGSAVYRNGKSKSADRWCWPFKEGIAEDYVCTRWFVQRWHELTGETVSGVKEIVSAPANEKVNEIFREFGEHLAYFLLDFIATEKPAAIVIGGNIAGAYDWFGPTVGNIIATKHTGIAIAPAVLGEEALLLGAVSSWLQQQHSTNISV